MTTQTLRFFEFSDVERERLAGLSRSGEDSTIEVHVQNRSARLSPEATAFFRDVIEHLVQGERVALIAEQREVSPNEAAMILGVSRPLVVHRMEVGDLPFRYVGKHRRARLADVLALKRRVDAQSAVLAALADETEALTRDHGL